MFKKTKNIARHNHQVNTRLIAEKNFKSELSN